MKKMLLSKFRLQKLLIAITLLSCFSFKMNAAYFWQVSSIISFTGSATYAQSAPANPLVLSIQQCAGGISQPHNSTLYNQTLYVNTLNSTVGGTVVSSNVISTPWNFAPTYSYTPSTANVGTLYYYYMLTSPSMTTCGFTGTLTSQIATVVVTAPAAPAEALHFDGINDHVNLGNGINSILDPINKFTAEAWVLPSSTVSPTFDAIVGNYNTVSGGMQFLLRQSGNRYEFFIDAGSGFVGVQSPVGTVTVSTWQHVAGTWDGSVLRLYINGVQAGTLTAVGSSFITHSNPVWIGGQSLNSEYFQGRIDEVRLWTRTLCQGEIQNNMNGEIPTTATGLIANYHFNQGLDSQPNPGVTTLLDASGSAYTGTLTNMALTGSTSNWVAPGAVSVTVTPFVSPTISVNSGAICSGSSFTMTPSGASTYTFSSGNAVVSPTISTTYSVTGTNSLGCVASNTAVASVTVSACSGTAAAALNFDGANDYVQVSTAIGLPLGNAPRTLEAWVKTTNTAASTVVFNYGTPTNNQRCGMIVEGGTGRLYFVGEFNDLQGTATSTVTDGNWHHIAVVYTGGTSGVLSLYVDGVFNTSAVKNLNTTGSTLRIGQRAFPQTGEFFNGNIDEVRIWNVARTQCELKTYMNCEIPTNATGLVANYHFNHGFDAALNPTVTTLVDASGSSNNGTLNNFALSGATSNWIAPGGVVNGFTTAVAAPSISVSAVPSLSVCTGGSVSLTGSGVDTYTWTGGITNGSSFTPSVSGSYTVTGTNTITTCTASAVSNVTVNAIPTVSVNSGNVCAGSTFTMTPSGASTYTFSSGSAVVTPSANSTYTVTGSSIAGCTATAISNVTVNPLPTVNATTSSTLICTLPTQQTATLSATGANTYTWSNSTTGSSTAVSPSVTTTYTVTGTDANGCENTAVVTQSVSSCTGIDNVSYSNYNVAVYPNPNNGSFTIELSQVNSNSTIEVINLLGEVVYTAITSNEKTQVNINNVNTGVYFVRIKDSSTTRIQKIVKQ